MLDLTTLEGRKAFAGEYAAKHLLDTALLCAVIEQESSWIQWAVRFEPAFEARYIKPALPNAPSTRQLTEAMSFGLMQIMGQTAIEFGFAGTYLTELCDPDTGTEYGCRKLRHCFDLHPDQTAALQTYNGGSNALYSQEVLARMPTYY